MVTVCKAVFTAEAIFFVKQLLLCDKGKLSGHWLFFGPVVLRPLNCCQLILKCQILFSKCQHWLSEALRFSDDQRFVRGCLILPLSSHIIQ